MTRFRKLETTVLLAAAAVVTGAAALAVPPGLINYQGVLRDANDAPVTASLDMVFRFHDAAMAGNELLVDRHLAGSLGDVAVEGGLFNVALGSGTLEDGSGAGTYATLAEVFRDHPEVYLEVEIETPMGFETLAPRTRIVAAAYSLSADHASTADDATDAINAVHATTADSATSADSAANATDAMHAVNADQATNAAAAADSDLLDGLDGGQFLRSDASSTLAAGTLTLAPGTTLDAEGSVHANGAIHVDADGPNGPQYLYFYEGGAGAESLAWSSSQTRFELTDELALSGPLAVGSVSLAPVTYNRFAGSTQVPESSLSGIDDLYLGGNVEVDGETRLAGSLRIGDTASGAPTIWFENGSVDERLLWQDGVFYLSDTLVIDGDLGASGTKNFVQNHPTRTDLSVVYTALEGDEPATFTRGVGRLRDGEARIVLGETFALVTNPEIGLTVHLTPRGEWAELYVESLTPSDMVVRATPGGPRDVVFDYIVFGLRIGYEDHRTIQPRTVDSRVPFADHYETLYADRPELRSSSPLRRHLGMLEAAGLAAPAGMEASTALRRAIGERDPEAPTRREPLPPADVDRPAEPMVTGSLSDVSVSADVPGSATNRGAAEAGGRKMAGEAGDSVDADLDPTRRERARPIGRALLVGDEESPPAPDFAVMQDVSEAVETGDVLVLDRDRPGRLRKGSEAGDPGLVGVVSMEPRSEMEVRPASAAARVAIVGIVLCKMDATYGEIRIGDLLTTSPTPGHAMRADLPLPGTILGKALASLDSGTGLIPVLVMPR